jgi:glycosyltransferase involved in cell wall biosynthesis
LLLRNAVAFDLFAKHVKPNSIAGDVKHPVIGFYGALADWVDIDLIAYLAKERPHCTFLLLGDVFVDVSDLKSLPNVHLLGRKPHEEMPLYLYHFDVCLIPFKINKITHAVDPVKFYEYISAGKPVVATSIIELLHYKDYLYLAETHDEFLEKVDLALTASKAH